MRLMMGWVATGLLALSGSAGAQAVPFEGTGIVQVPAEVAGIDEVRAIQGRAQARARIASELEVRQEKVTPEQCPARVTEAVSANAYQVFVVSSSGNYLVPLAYDVSFRSRVDAAKLSAVCQGAASIVISKFSEKVRRSTDAKVQRDYVIALAMADWAQAQMDGSGLVGREMPVDVTADPFSVLSKITTGK